jgi:hypothetical protein
MSSNGKTVAFDSTYLGSTPSISASFLFGVRPMAGQRSLKPLMGVRAPHPEPVTNIADWSSPVARQVHTLEAASSNLASATTSGRVKRLPFESHTLKTLGSTPMSRYHFNRVIIGPSD